MKIFPLLQGVLSPVPAPLRKEFFMGCDCLMIQLMLMKDLDFYIQSDPAAHGSMNLIMRSYNSFKAIASYRVAHHLAVKAKESGNAELSEYARLISDQAKVGTGIEIHPSAEIGCPFMIDHGWGVVIGETTVIGNYCCLLNGVILGAKGIVGNKDMKRHPNLGDHVQVGAFVEILGDISIGSHTIISPRVKITKSIPKDSVVVRRTEYILVKNGENCLFTL